jgi:hypothetical protein
VHGEARKLKIGKNTSREEIIQEEYLDARQLGE